MLRRLLSLALLLAAGGPLPASAQTPPPKKAPHVRGAPAAPAAASAPGPREPKRRQLTLDDASVTTLPEIHVAGGSASMIAFQVPIEDGGVVLGNVKDLFFPIAQTEKTFFMVPKADLRDPATVNVSLKDGTVLTFKCVSVPGDFDAQVDVVLKLERRASQDSAPALRNVIGQLRGQLDECKATTGDAGTQKVASLLLTQSLDQPQTFTRHALSGMERDNRLLIESRWAYKLLGLTYVVLVLENRDPERLWVLDHAEVKMNGSAENADVQVKSVVTEFPSLAPDTTEKVIVGFTTPGSSSRQTVTISLHEKDGTRRISLGGLNL